MNVDIAVDLVRESLLLVLTLGAPVLIGGLAIGLVVGVLQAATQVQDQTLGLVPKMIGMVVLVLILAPWMGQRIMEFAQRMFGN